MIRFTQPLWWPFSFRLGSRHGFAYCKLPANRYISWNLEPDWNERVVWECGPLNITRPETAEEEEERLYAEKEAAYEEHCHSFYSY